jgi:hypothetical protein
MAREKKTERRDGSAVMPPKVDFQTWKKRFDLVVNSPAWECFKALMAREYDWLETSAPAPDKRTKCLLFIYEMTACRAFSPTTQITNKYTRGALEKLTPQIEDFIARLRKARGTVLANDNLLVIDLKLLDQALAKAAEISRFYLLCLQRPYAHQTNAIDQSLFLLGILRRNNFPEEQAYALVKLALIAHGFHANDLVEFDIGKIEAGNLRKRMNARDVTVRRLFVFEHSQALHRQPRRPPWAPGVEDRPGLKETPSRNGPMLRKNRPLGDGSERSMHLTITFKCINSDCAQCGAEIQIQRYWAIGSANADSIDDDWIRKQHCPSCHSVGELIIEHGDRTFSCLDAFGQYLAGLAKELKLLKKLGARGVADDEEKRRLDEVVRLLSGT